MKILLVDNGTRFLGRLTSLSEKFGDVVIRSFGEVRPTIKADMLILSGGHALPVRGHTAEFKNELELISTFTGPIIGVCLGHEILAHWDNSQLERLPFKERGIRDIEIVEHDPVFGSQGTLQVYESHRWAVKSTNNFMPLAKSETGIEVIRHNTKPIYGFQFHPEQLIGGIDGKAIFERAVIKLREG